MEPKRVRALEVIHLRLAAHRPELLAELTREVGERRGENGLHGKAMGARR